MHHGGGRMTTKSRVLGAGALAWLGMVAAGAGYRHRNARAPQPQHAEGAAAVRPARAQEEAPAKAAPARATIEPVAVRAALDKYCVTCHNQRLKTAGLMLDTLDVAEIGAHADTWEKVVLK